MWLTASLVRPEPPCGNTGRFPAYMDLGDGCGPGTAPYRTGGGARSARAGVAGPRRRHTRSRGEAYETRLTVVAYGARQNGGADLRFARPIACGGRRPFPSSAACQRSRRSAGSAAAASSSGRRRATRGVEPVGVGTARERPPALAVPRTRPHASDCRSVPAHTPLPGADVRAECAAGRGRAERQRLTLGAGCGTVGHGGLPGSAVQATPGKGAPSQCRSHRPVCKPSPDR